MIQDSPLFKHCAGITLSVPLTGLKKWDKSEEILNDSPIAYMNASQPSQELDNTYDLNYCPGKLQYYYFSLIFYTNDIGISGCYSNNIRCCIKRKFL